MNNLKLRVGYGITGNSGGVDAYGTTTQAYVYTGNGLTLNGQNSSLLSIQVLMVARIWVGKSLITGMLVWTMAY